METLGRTGRVLLHATQSSDHRGQRGAQSSKQLFFCHDINISRAAVAELMTDGRVDGAKVINNKALIKGPAKTTGPKTFTHPQTETETHNREGRETLVPDLSPDQRTVPCSIHVGVKGNLKVL